MLSWLCFLLGVLGTLPGQSASQGFQHVRFPMPGRQPMNDWSNQGGWAHAANNAPLGGDIRMPDGRLFQQVLHVGGKRIYFIDVPKSGSVAVSVHPRRGRITWNITYDNVNVMRHPFFTHRLQAPYQPSRSRGRRHVWERIEVMSPHHSGRQRRSAVRGAVRHNFDFDVPELDAGLGQSLGPGSITYSKEDTGGRYIMDLANRGAEPAEYFIYATLSPHSSPYPRAVGDPQAKVEDVLRTELTLKWIPIPEAPLGTQYCVFYHNANAHVPSDVHSSPHAAYLDRPTAVRAGCTHLRRMRIRGLRPDQEYHLDVFSQSPTSKLYTTYLGVRTTTDHRSFARTQPAGPLPHLPGRNNNEPVHVDPNNPAAGGERVLPHPQPRLPDATIREGGRSVVDLDIGRPPPGAAINSAPNVHARIFCSALWFVGLKLVFSFL